MGHKPQSSNDEIVVMLHNGVTIACGYMCSKCRKPVYPLGSSFPNEILTEREKKALSEECINGTTKA